MRGPLPLADWRRHVHELYAEVRALAVSDPAQAWILWRAVRDELFRDHPESPLEDRSRFGGLRYFPYDPRLRFHAPLVAEPAGPRLEIAVSGSPDHQAQGTGAMAFRRVGRVALPLGALPVYWIEDYAGGLFIPFRDRTSGHETYAGGRYLLDTAKGADLGVTAAGELVLDLNFAFHPSCFHDPRWSCPLAPRESGLEARVEAGERV